MIIQVDSSHGSVLAETLYNGVGVAEDEAQNNSTTPRSARGPPNAIPAQQSNVSYASLEEARKHAGSKCEYHMNKLRERGSAIGAEIPTEAYTDMHHTDECLSPHNQYLACTIFPGGMEAVISMHAIRNNAARNTAWTHAKNVMRRIIEQRALNETTIKLNEESDKQTTEVVQQIIENTTLDAGGPLQQRNGNVHRHSSITEKESSAEKHAHGVVHRAVEEARNAADAEDAGAQEVPDAVYDLNGAFYRLKLGRKVINNVTRLRRQWTECVEGVDHQAKFIDKAHESYVAAYETRESYTTTRSTLR